MAKNPVEISKGTSGRILENLSEKLQNLTLPKFLKEFREYFFVETSRGVPGSFE